MSKCKKIILSICAVFIAVFGVLFACFNNSDNNSVAYADSVDISYSFTGSNLFTFTAFLSRNNAGGWYACSIRNSFYKNYGNTNVYAKSDFYWSNNTSGSFDTSYKTFYQNGSSYVQGDVPLAPNSHRFVYFASTVGDANNNQGFPCDIILTGNFNGNVNSVTLGTKSTMTNRVVNFTGWKCFYITYNDSDSNTLSYEFIMPSVAPYDTRTYYLTQDFSDNQIYQQGYQQGLLDNQSNIYNNGYNAGNTVGYNNGYNDGLNSTDQYSFFNLFGAVLDAPLATLRGLLNFNIFGVNLLSLFLGLLTLAIILLLLRLIRGGK